MKLIAFYLPQFHRFPENDVWWGEGFTEWTNVKKAERLFPWHNQPRIPYKNNYYNLDKNFRETMMWQINIAKKYGLYGFCFYHYWFKNGKKLMEKPIEKFLEDKSLDIPFCLSWANEPWTRAWDGSTKEIIMPQEYGNEIEWKQHFEYLMAFFKDKRYIKVNNKPMILIYRLELIPRLDEMLSLWIRLATEAGFPGLYIVSQGSVYGITQNKSLYIDDYILYEPGYTHVEFSRKGRNLKKQILTSPCIWLTVSIQTVKRYISTKLKIKSVTMNTTILNYDIFWKHILNRKYNNHMIPGAFVDWDNSPRRGKNGARIFKGATPKKFEKYMRKLIKKTKKETDKDMIFIDAWNEWAEGTYLEPDIKNGYGYLKALKAALGNN